MNRSMHIEMVEEDGYIISAAGPGASRRLICSGTPSALSTIQTLIVWLQDQEDRAPADNMAVHSGPVV